MVSVSIRTRVKRETLAGLRGRARNVVVSIRTRVKRETLHAAVLSEAWAGFDPHPREAGDVYAGALDRHLQQFRSAPA